MAVKIGHASGDENGRISGGKAGDQSKKELCIRTWYNNSWIALVRPNKKSIAEKIATAMEQACNNDNIGYDQSQRTTLFEQAKKKKWKIDKITTKCETDCSALVAVCVNAAGIKVSKDIWTGNEVQALSCTGKFTVYTSSDYLTKSTKLKRGDILVSSGHTVVVLSDGTAVADTTPTKPTTTSKKTTWTPRIGDKVIVSGKIYCNGDGSGGSIKKSKETMYIVDLVNKDYYKHHIGVASKKNGARQGWANIKILKEA